MGKQTYIIDSRNNIKNRIFHLLLKYETGLNIRQIARKLKIYRSVTSKRLNELRNFVYLTYDSKEYGIIATHRSLDGVTNKTVSYWGLEIIIYHEKN